MTIKNINKKEGIKEESFTESEVKKIFNSVDEQEGFDINLIMSLYKSHRAFFRNHSKNKKGIKP